MTQQQMKIAAARIALEHVRSGMSLGLGSGSTSNEFVKLLGEAMREGRLRDVRCTCTSVKTESLAKSVGIEVSSLADMAPLDLAIDGADEIDSQLRLIKGHGGALLREKIVEQSAKRFIVIADESKVVTRLGQGPLPVEVTPFAVEVVLGRLQRFSPQLRMREGAPFITDEQHRILDIRIADDPRDIDEVVAEIRRIAGVVDTGYFPFEASEAIVAGAEGVRSLRR
ncbi:MAG TPA: ribose 5-phosphate isomerase A [Thermoanaerobaculia bacterium]|nr:ribose 5-phosphate isomerase A [Thermoanaerobaculia bacterium]